jgi:hypothetical protein
MRFSILGHQMRFSKELSDGELMALWREGEHRIPRVSDEWKLII